MSVQQILAWTIPATIVGVAWAVAWAYVRIFEDGE
jgi:hypothetical protein